MNTNAIFHLYILQKVIIPEEFNRQILQKYETFICIDIFPISTICLNSTKTSGKLLTNFR